MSETDTVTRAAEMLDRLQKEATKRVLSAYRFESNLVRGSVIELSDPTIVGQRNVVVRFDMNGEEVETTFPFVVDGSYRFDKAKAFGMLVDEIGKHVADVVKEQALQFFADDLAKTPEFGGKKAKP